MRVESLRLEWIEALIEGDAAFTERFGIAVIEGWAGFPEALPHALDAARRHNADPWGSHLFFDDDGALVGFGGFKGPPTGGEVEIGYAIAPARQGRGLATTATRTLIDWARDRGAIRVIAHTLATPNASTAVLVHCGFTRTPPSPTPTTASTTTYGAGNSNSADLTTTRPLSSVAVPICRSVRTVA